jgi:pilus assembly protein CpaD
MVVSSVPQDDYQVRHPIVVGEAPYTLQILAEPVSGRFDGRSAARLREFASLYRRFGRGPIMIMPPDGPGGPPSAEPVRRALWNAGVHARIIVTPYPAGPNAVAPVRLSFFGLKATVADRCGQWPRDLGIGSGAAEDWSNKPHWNFGCSYQTAFAAQVADPRDLVSPQAESPPDTVVRTRGIDNRRQGLDPSTWRLDFYALSNIGANAQ